MGPEQRKVPKAPQRGEAPVSSWSERVQSRGAAALWTPASVSVVSAPLLHGSFLLFSSEFVLPPQEPWKEQKLIKRGKFKSSEK